MNPQSFHSWPYTDALALLNAMEDGAIDSGFDVSFRVQDGLLPEAVFSPYDILRQHVRGELLYFLREADFPFIPDGAPLSASQQVVNAACNLLTDEIARVSYLKVRTAETVRTMLSQGYAHSGKFADEYALYRSHSYRYQLLHLLRDVAREHFQSLRD